MTFNDHFSGVADDYAAYRPHYPEELFAYVAGQCEQRTLAVDVGAGSGQATVGLAPHFARVIGTDPSAQQLAQAPPLPNVAYAVAPAEELPIQDHTVDLVTVAAAAHWFHLPRFYAEVDRVLRPGGVLAIWTYYQAYVNEAVDPVLQHFQHTVLGPYWPAERAPVNRRYGDLPFPYAEWPTPGFKTSASFSLDDLMRYLGTWSAIQRYREQKGIDPLARVRPEFERVWGAGQLTVTWPLVMRMGQKAG